MKTMELITTLSEKFCSNCLKENDDVFLVMTDKCYYACPDCRVTYAKDRTGLALVLGEEVLIKNYHPKTDNRVFIIKGIFIHEECESGRMIYLADKETGRDLKSLLDVNWLQKLVQSGRGR